MKTHYLTARRIRRGVTDVEALARLVYGNRARVATCGVSIPDDAEVVGRVAAHRTGPAFFVYYNSENSEAE